MRFLCGNLDLKIIIFDYKQRLLVARLRYLSLRGLAKFHDDGAKIVDISQMVQWILDIVNLRKQFTIWNFFTI